MQKQYTKDKTARLSFRVNQALYDWVESRAKLLGVSPCDFARSLLFQQMSVEAALSSIDRTAQPVKTNRVEPVAEIARAGRCGHKKQ